MSILDNLRQTNGQEPPRSSLTQDELFGLLANQRRRLVVRMVAAHARTIKTLAARIAEHEVSGHVGRDEERRVYIALYQTHLDKLEQASVVKQADDGSVTAGPNHAAAMYALRSAAPVTVDGGAEA